MSPGYWDGHDVFDAPTLPPGAPHQEIPLNRREYLAAKIGLHLGVEEIIAGNSTEVHYNPGTEFSPAIDTNSLVVMDTELLINIDFDDPERQLQPDQSGDSYITRPYVEYWLSRQGETNDTEGVGSQTLTFGETNMTYGRSLSWGVILAKDDEQVVQTFDFRDVRLRPDRKALAPITAPKRAATRLPLAIGEVTVCRPLRVDDDATVRALQRHRSVDVVYARPSDRGKRRARAHRSLADLVLPKLATRRVPTY